jgi:hypothetical protein
VFLGSSLGEDALQRDGGMLHQFFLSLVFNSMFQYDKDYVGDDRLMEVLVHVEVYD